MRSIDEHSAEAYLRETGHIGPNEPVRVRELTGGVSNMVLLVEREQTPGGEFVIKQARAQLRTKHAWFSSLERIWREADVLAICDKLLRQSRSEANSAAQAVAVTPRILFEDRENYLFAMTAAPRPNATWKSQLLRGDVNPEIATACGQLLATLHGRSWLDADLENKLDDCTLFHELRVDPYYRTLAEVCRETRPAIESLIESLATHRRSLVHADFSPKNLLVFAGGLMMVDFETGHFGDPAFDLGFFQSHLVLKACYHIPRYTAYLDLSEAFRYAYDELLAPQISDEEFRALWARGIRHFAACAWARLDAKSPVEYLTDPQRRERMRAVCRQVFAERPTRWPEVIAICQRTFDA